MGEIMIDRIGRRRHLRRTACALAAGTLLLAPSAATADQGGVSFWVPGFFGSLAAVPPTPGWSVATIYYHTSTDAGRNVQFARGGALVAGLVADADIGFVSPGYTFATPVLWGGLATVSVLAGYGHLEATVDAVVTGPLGRTIALSRTDDRTGFGDVPLFAKVNWNAGVHNYMLYTAVNVPNGAYERRLANLSIGHWASDSGVGYTYLNPKSGWEFSAVLGFTYNWENYTTDYRNGIDMHLDWAASKFLNKQVFVGAVGYAYQQVTGDSGRGAVLGGFESRVFGIGPQIGFIFPIDRSTQGFVGLKGYWEFEADHRPEGWNTWLTLSISPAPPRQPMK
jgi:hypothetical protein